MRVVVDVSSNRYGSLASCCFPLAAVIPPRVAAGRAFFPDTLRWEFPPSRRLGSASLFTELRLMKTVCLVRRSSPIAACGRVASESISLAVISGTRSRRARVRSYEEHIPPGHHEAHFSGTDFFARRHLASFPAFRGERFLGLTVISRASRHHRQIRARGMGDGEESCAVCSRSIGGPKAETLTAECCRRRFHDLCIARHCATRRDEVRRLERVVFSRCRRSRAGGLTSSPPSTSRRLVHLSISLPPRRTAGPLPRVLRPLAQARGGCRGRRRRARRAARQAGKARMGRLGSRVARLRDEKGVRASLRRSKNALETDRGRENARNRGGSG